MAAAQHTNPTPSPVLVLGMGLSGQSMVRHLVARGHTVSVADTRKAPPYLEALRQEFPGLETICGKIPVDRFDQFDEIVASPGVDTRAYAAYNPIGDIELFAREAGAPVIAVTGSNGKSTVTMQVSALLDGLGVDVRTGGNIGVPALQLLSESVPELYVLELSSFQLENTHSLRPVSAAVLNISEDHMDRYDSLEKYVEAKSRIFMDAGCAVINRDHGVTPARAIRTITFGLDSPPGAEDFGIARHDGEDWFMHGQRRLIPCSRLRLPGNQNRANALAAMALVHGAGYELHESGMDALCDFDGLPHRCELVMEENGVRWINDSKGTNVGATLAAIEGLGDNIILIAGGQGKGADFKPLGQAVSRSVRQVILIGEDRDRIAAALDAGTCQEMADSLRTAIERAHAVARPGDTVLFSPACASFDMFESYAHRGDCFRVLVQEIMA